MMLMSCLLQGKIRKMILCTYQYRFSGQYLFELIIDESSAFYRLYNFEDN
jgi:hypothetical protein